MAAERKLGDMRAALVQAEPLADGSGNPRGINAEEIRTAERTVRTLNALDGAPVRTVDMDFGIKAAVFTKKGGDNRKLGGSDEDTAGVSPDTFVLADGVSLTRYAVRSAQEAVNAILTTSDLDQGLELARLRVTQLAREPITPDDRRKFQRMHAQRPEARYPKVDSPAANPGTTLLAGKIFQNEEGKRVLRWKSIGDSPLLLIHNGQVRLLNDREMAVDNDGFHTNFLGADYNPLNAVRETVLEEGDRVIALSDGMLSGRVTVLQEKLAEREKELGRPLLPDELINFLNELVETNAAKNNIADRLDDRTAVVLYVGTPTMVEPRNSDPFSLLVNLLPKAEESRQLTPLEKAEEIAQTIKTDPTILKFSQGRIATSFVSAGGEKYQITNFTRELQYTSLFETDLKAASVRVDDHITVAADSQVRYRLIPQGENLIVLDLTNGNEQVMSAYKPHSLHMADGHDIIATLIPGIGDNLPTILFMDHSETFNEHIEIRRITQAERALQAIFGKPNEGTREITFKDVQPSQTILPFTLLEDFARETGKKRIVLQFTTYTGSEYIIEGKLYGKDFRWEAKRKARSILEEDEWIYFNSSSLRMISRPSTTISDRTNIELIAGEDDFSQEVYSQLDPKQALEYVYRGDPSNIQGFALGFSADKYVIRESKTLSHGAIRPDTVALVFQ